MYVKWQRDFLDIIHENGYVPPVAPGRFDGPTINGPWWGGMIVYLPWKLYQQYADKRILEESYGAMKKYVGYLHTIDSSYIVTWGLGDWLEPGTEHDGARPKMTPVPVTSTIGFYLYADITARTAAILGFNEDLAYYSDLANKIKGAFNQHFFNPETGRYAKFSQASQVLPLRFGMVPEDKRQLVTRQLVEKIAAADDHPGTGFVSTPVFLASLSDLGLGELAYTVANQRTYPSWYDMVFNHGTKIFKEDWQGGMVQMPPLGGGLGYWFYYALAGIRPDTAAPGFRNIIIKPDMVSGLNWARGEYRSVYGVIRSEWKREGGRVTLEVEIPANTTATVWLPTNDPTQITESGHPVIAGKEYRSVQTENGSTVLRVGSGTYVFTVATHETNRR
jgi:alpha-L-rhamnosidase